MSLDSSRTRCLGVRWCRKRQQTKKPIRIPRHGRATPSVMPAMSLAGSPWVEFGGIGLVWVGFELTGVVLGVLWIEVVEGGRGELDKDCIVIAYA